MNYVNYDTRIVLKLGVKLEGWTYTEMVTPLAIDDLGDIRALLEALRGNYCRWVKLTDDEVRRHKRDITAREERGEEVGRKRKARSDKGTVKGPRSKRAASIAHVGHINDNELGSTGDDNQNISQTAASTRDKRTTANTTRKKGRKENHKASQRRKSVTSQLPPAAVLPRSQSVLSNTDLEDFE